MTSIRVDRDTLDALTARAKARGVSLDVYLRELAAEESPAAARELTEAEFDRWLDELSSGPVPASSLPPDFSRRDIYGDHD